jgi:tetratricopeptide (TPR) repeat protein
MHRSASSAALCLLLMSGGAQAATCEDTRFLDDRTTVIEPCTKVLADPNLSIERRVRALEFRARGLRFAKREREAEIDIESGLVLAPDDGALHRVRSSMRRERGDWKGAWEDGLVAIRQLPDKIDSYTVLIDVAIATGQLETARELIEHALTIDPESVDLMVWQAAYHRYNQEFLEAAEALDKVLKSSRQLLLPLKSRTGPLGLIGG